MKQNLDGARRSSLLSVSDKAEPPATPSLAVVYHVGLGDGAELGENL
jgi:hypothetical protein